MLYSYLLTDRYFRDENSHHQYAVITVRILELPLVVERLQVKANVNHIIKCSIE